MCLRITGGEYVHFHMLNEQSRKYFQRAWTGSGNAFSTYALRRANYVDFVQGCCKIFDINRLTYFLKTTNTTNLVRCYHQAWYPTIENPNTKGAFLTKSPEEIYSSDNPPIMDAVFNFASQVIGNAIGLISTNLFILMIFQEALQAYPKMVFDTKPLIGEKWNETNFQFRYEGFSKQTHPKVILSCSTVVMKLHVIEVKYVLNFQEYEIIVEKLRRTYYENRAGTVSSKNIALKSDLHMVYSVVKTAILQANANSNGINKSQQKNTFLYR